MSTETQAPDPAPLTIYISRMDAETLRSRGRCTLTAYTERVGNESNEVALTTIPAPEGAPGDMLLVPRELIKDAVESVDDYRCSLEFGAHDRKLLGRLKAALAAPRVTEGAQALTETQIERAWRLGFRHACDAERLNSDEEWGYKGANVIEEVQALAAPAPQDSLDSAQSSKGVAMQAAPVALTDEQIDKLPWGPHEGNPVTFAEGLRDFANVVTAEFCRINGIPAPQTKEPTNDR